MDTYVFKGFCSSTRCAGINPVNKIVFKTLDKKLSECPDCHNILVWKKFRSDKHPDIVSEHKLKRTKVSLIVEAMNDGKWYLIDDLADKLHQKRELVLAMINYFKHIKEFDYEIIKRPYDKFYKEYKLIKKGGNNENNIN